MNTTSRSKIPIRLSSPSVNGISLRSADEADLERLRRWKNTNRFSFFYQNLITKAGQAEWYRLYQGRPHDYMFMVHAGDRPIGCMALRRLEDGLDIYNVIRGDRVVRGKGQMRGALAILLSFARKKFPDPIRLKVLRSNSALQWYKDNGFVETRVHPTYVEMRLDLGRFHPLAIDISKPAQVAAGEPVS